MGLNTLKPKGAAPRQLKKWYASLMRSRQEEQNVSAPPAE